MNIKEYIASGILENYLLGLLDEAKQQEVERNAAIYPEIQAELDAMEAALNTYAQSNAVPMRAGLQDEILATVDELEGTSPQIQSSTKVGRSGSIASILLALGLGIALLWLYQKLNKTQLQLKDQQEQLNIVQENCDRNIKFLESQLDILRDPNTRGTPMRKGDLSTEKTPDAAIAIVYNNAINQTAYLDIVDLPAPITGKQYQLWGITINDDGSLNPTSMGIVDPNLEAGHLAEMKFLEDIFLYAITLEDLGEQTVPDLTQLYVIGETQT